MSKRAILCFQAIDMYPVLKPLKKKNFISNFCESKYNDANINQLRFFNNIQNIYLCSLQLNIIINTILTMLFNFRIHICITHLHTKPGVASLFVEDVRQELNELLKTPHVELSGKVINCIKLLDEKILL